MTHSSYAFDVINSNSASYHNAIQVCFQKTAFKHASNRVVENV